MATIDEVQTEASDNKLKALQAMAAGTSDPYSSSQDAVRTSQSSALSQLAQDAAGAPAGAINELAPTVSGPGDAALASLAAQAGPYDNSLSAINASGVAYGNGAGGLGSGSRAAGGHQFPVQYYGPYARYGGYGSASEFDDAVLAAARAAAEHESAQMGSAAASTHDAITAKGVGALGAAGAMVGAHVGSTPHAPAVRAVGIGNAMPARPTVYSDVPGIGLQRPAPPPSTYDMGATMAPLQAGVERGLIGSQAAAVDPLNLDRFAQQAAIDQFGAEPNYAQGHFSPEWAMDLALKDLAGPNDYQQATNEYQQRQANGGFTDEEMRQQASVNDALNTAAIQASPEYQSGVNFIDGTLQATAQGAKPPTLDEVRLALAKQGIPSDVLSQLVRDYGNLFPTAAFVNNLPTG